MRREGGRFGIVRWACLALPLGLVLWGCGWGKESQLKRRASRGDVQAMYTLGQANLSTVGDGFVKHPNYRDAAHWFEEGAKRGHAPSMYWLTQIGGITDEERVMWLKKGAELGNGACVTELINAYRNGKYGLQQDHVESFRWVKIGWEMDFKERAYDHQQKAVEMKRLLATHRVHLQISLEQSGRNKEEIAQIMAQIQ